ncbi:hypothetical protein [Cellvibrio sp.]|uniref:hypothetical protein n=1 Tax=Cellvibrio sp. TaxID=1965322 RepID=UPI00396484D9
MLKYGFLISLLFVNDYSFADSEIEISKTEIVPNKGWDEYDRTSPKYFLKARIFNNSAQPLTGYSGVLTFSDCEKNGKCVVIGTQPIVDGTDAGDVTLQWIGSTGAIPPNQARDFARPIYNLPLASGSLRYSITISPSFGARYTISEAISRESQKRFDKCNEYYALPIYERVLKKSPGC